MQPATSAWWSNLQTGHAGAALLHPVGAAVCGLVIEHGGTSAALVLFGSVSVLLALAAALDEPIRREGRA